MIFSRFALAALSVVGALAAPRPLSGFSNGLQASPRVGVVVTRDAPVSPLVDATAKINALQDQVADAMAGPKQEREAKFINITYQALQVVQSCNTGVSNKLPLLKLSGTQTGDQMGEFSESVWRVLRACKGLHSAQVATNINDIIAQLGKVKLSATGLLGDLLAPFLESFDIYKDRVSMVYSAVSA